MDSLDTSQVILPSSTILKIGLTGGIGSGKSAVAQLLEKKGAFIIDTDKIAHQITSSNGQAMTQIKAEFGDAFVNTDGSLNRSAMRELVFNNPKAKAKLENITHPLIHQETERLEQEAIKNKPPYIVFMIPLLIESGRWLNQTPPKIECLLVVDCPKELQVQRVVQRNEINPELIEKIIATQASREKRTEVADYIIDNSSDFEHLERQCEELHGQLLNHKKH
jgi:dephospho-CoA kinase